MALLRDYFLSSSREVNLGSIMEQLTTIKNAQILDSYLIWLISEIVRRVVFAQCYTFIIRISHGK